MNDMCCVISVIMGISLKRLANTLYPLFGHPFGDFFSSVFAEIRDSFNFSLDKVSEESFFLLRKCEADIGHILYLTFLVEF